jgi:hypothetical protein
MKKDDEEWDKEDMEEWKKEWAIMKKGAKSDKCLDEDYHKHPECW